MKRILSYLNFTPDFLLVCVLISMIIMGGSCHKTSLYSTEQAGTMPIIDGKVDSIWSKAIYEPIKNKNAGSGYIKDSLDLSAKFKMLWDSKNLYFLVNVIDDKKYNIEQLENSIDIPDPYNCDCVELFFDAKNYKRESFSRNEFDSRYEFVYSRKTVSGTYLSDEGITMGQSDFEGGYLMEIKIPFSTLNIQLKENTVFGFEIGINDNDNSPTEDFYLLQRSILYWSDKNLAPRAWENTSVYGNVKLIKRG